MKKFKKMLNEKVQLVVGDGRNIKITFIKLSLKTIIICLKEFLNN